MQWVNPYGVTGIPGWVPGEMTSWMFPAELCIACSCSGFALSPRALKGNEKYIKTTV